MFRIEEGLTLANIKQYINVYYQFYLEMQEKCCVEKVRLLRIMTEILKSRISSRVIHILLYKDNNIIGLEEIELIAGEKDAIVSDLYVKPEYRKVITIDGKSAFAVSHLINYANQILEKHNIENVYISTHRFLIKNILLYIREGFVPYELYHDGTILMARNREKALSQDRKKVLIDEIKNDNIISIVDLNSPTLSYKQGDK